MRRIGRRNERGGATRPFNPSQLTPYVWMEADTGITADGSNRVSAYASKVNGINFAQATGANQPLYIAADAGYNSRPILHIDSAARHMIATVSVPFPFSTFEYGEYSGTGSNGHTLLNGGTAYHSTAWSYSGGNQRFFASDGASSTTPQIADATGAKRSLYRGAAADKTVTLIRNAGSPTTGTATNAPVASTADTAYLGYIAGVAQVQKLAVYLIFRYELTAAQVTRLHNFYVNKYG